MLGLMQSHNLLISSLITNAERHHGEVEIVSRRVEGDVHRTTWAGIAQRSRQIANALTGESLTFSDRVATLAWNGYRHLEMYFGVSGSGHVLHTLNPRLHPEQLAWIINHAEDKIVAFDMSFLPLVQAVQAKCPTVQKWVAMCDASALPADSGVPNLVAYEAWMGQQSDVYEWPDFDENSASSMCYTVAPRATPKAWFTATAPPCCTRGRPPCLMRSTSAAATPSCRWCPCSMPTLGPCLIQRRPLAPNWCSPALPWTANRFTT